MFFHIVDSMGGYILCCAMGHNASNKALVDGVDAVLFHGAGRAAMGSSPASIYFLKDGLIVPTGRRTVPVPKRLKINIQSNTGSNTG